MLAFRIVMSSFAGNAFSGEGARLYGGRWNPPGIRCVYVASSRALAALELLVHASPELLHVEFQLVEIEIPDAMIETRLHPPRGWDELPAGTPSQEFGARWLTNSGAKVALAVPSILIPEEMNYLLNPLHPAFPDVRIRHQRAFQLDRRLVAF